MSRTIPALATVGRAYASGRCATLRPPTPSRAYRLQAQLAAASPEVRAAYAAGCSADPRLPLPPAAEVLAEVVQRLARVSVEDPCP